MSTIPTPMPTGLSREVMNALLKQFEGVLSTREKQWQEKCKALTSDLYEAKAQIAATAPAGRFDLKDLRSNSSSDGSKVSSRRSSRAVRSPDSRDGMKILQMQMRQVQCHYGTPEQRKDAVVGRKVAGRLQYAGYYQYTISWNRFKMDQVHVTEDQLREALGSIPANGSVVSCTIGGLGPEGVNPWEQNPFAEAIHSWSPTSSLLGLHKADQEMPSQKTIAYNTARQRELKTIETSRKVSDRKVERSRWKQSLIGRWVEGELMPRVDHKAFYIQWNDKTHQVQKDDHVYVSRGFVHRSLGFVPPAGSTVRCRIQGLGPFKKPTWQQSPHTDEIELIELAEASPVSPTVYGTRPPRPPTKSRTRAASAVSPTGKARSPSIPSRTSSSPFGGSWRRSSGTPEPVRRKKDVRTRGNSWRRESDPESPEPRKVDHGPSKEFASVRTGGRWARSMLKRKSESDGSDPKDDPRGPGFSAAPSKHIFAYAFGCDDMSDDIVSVIGTDSEGEIEGERSQTPSPRPVDELLEDLLADPALMSADRSQASSISQLSPAAASFTPSPPRSKSPTLPSRNVSFNSCTVREETIVYRSHAGSWGQDYADWEELGANVKAKPWNVPEKRERNGIYDLLALRKYSDC